MASVFFKREHQYSSLYNLKQKLHDAIILRWLSFFKLFAKKKKDKSFNVDAYGVIYIIS